MLSFVLVRRHFYHLSPKFFGSSVSIFSSHPNGLLFPAPLAVCGLRGGLPSGTGKFALLGESVNVYLPRVGRQSLYLPGIEDELL